MKGLQHPPLVERSKKHNTENTVRYLLFWDGASKTNNDNSKKAASERDGISNQVLFSILF
jgi:hypothetical protein